MANNQLIINNQFNNFLQKSMDCFPQVLLLFYRKITANHQNQIELIHKLHSLLESINSHLISSLKQINNESLVNKQIKQTSQGSKINQIVIQSQIMRKSEQFWNCDWLYMSGKLNKAVNFAILNNFIATENILNFKEYYEQINREISQSTIKNDIMQTVTYVWSRIGQIILNKKRIKWQHSLLEAVKKFPPQFHELTYNLMTKRLKKRQVQEQNNQQILKCIGNELRLIIIYFQIEDKRIIKVEKLGCGSDSVLIGWIYDLHKFVIPSKMPKAPQNIQKKQEILRFLTVDMQDLMTQFDANFKNIKELSFLVNQIFMQDPQNMSYQKKNYQFEQNNV